MNATRTLFVSLVTLSAASGCGSSAPAPTYGGSAKSMSDAPAAEPVAPSSSGPSAASGSPASSRESAAPPAPAAGAEADAAEGRAERAPALDEEPLRRDRDERRPGLATKWGERRHSRVTTAPFVRAEPREPFAVEKIFYNDSAGIAEMSDRAHRRGVHRFSVGAGHLDVGLRRDGGGFLTGFVAGGDNFVVGDAGQRYTIVVDNHSPGRVEAVVSVDGLDVVDGEPASVGKRGYLIEPFGHLEIDGFRTSTEEVAAFRFGSVEQSYASRKHDDTRNVGVIGIALFHERGDSPRAWGRPSHRRDAHRRRTADPFPNRFATPPR